MTPRRERPLGLAEIAELLHVGKETPFRWRYRRATTYFPDPDGHISRSVPYWWPATIERWARATGRWPGDAIATGRLEAEETRRAALREAEERHAEAEHLRARALTLAADADRAEHEATQALQRANAAPG